MNRTIAFEGVVGSHNYFLNREDSDKDKKTFYYPSFEDLYSGDKQSIALVSKMEDNELHDIRKYPMMLYKANVNFIEPLFSVEIAKKDELFEELIVLREDIARMNLPYLFDACFLGMFDRKYREFLRDTNYIDLLESEEERRKKINKHVMVGYRILDFLERYANTNFESFEQAIRYRHEVEDERVMKEQLFAFRDGRYTDPVMEEMLLRKKERVAKLKDVYKSYSINHSLNQHIQKRVKEHVRLNLLKEFNQ